MSKLFLFLLIAGVAALIFGGVIDVSVNPGKLSELPGTLMDRFGDRSLVEQTRARAVGYKRAGEQWIVKDIDQQLELALGYVESDVGRLDELTSKHSDQPELIIPQAELLIKSVDRIGDLLVEAPADKVLVVREETNKTLGNARGSLARLEELQGSDSEFNSQFAQVTSVLEWHIGELDNGGDGIQQSAVAGARDGEDPDPSPTPVEAIPLSF